MLLRLPSAPWTTLLPLHLDHVPCTNATCSVQYQELVVQRSLVAPALDLFGETCPGLGLWLPPTRSGRTQTLHFRPGVRGVKRVLRKSYKHPSPNSWRADFAILDMDDPDYAFVPTHNPPECRLFYIQHVREDYTHLLLWHDSHPYLTCSRRLQAGEELTFDYGTNYRDVAADNGYEEDGFLGSLSLSAPSQEDTTTGSGARTERSLNRNLVDRITHCADLHGEEADMDPELMIHIP